MKRRRQGRGAPGAQGRWAPWRWGVVRGHRVELIRDGEFFDRLLEDLADARRFVHLEFYIFRADVTGRRIIAALAACVQRGVEVRLVYDAVGILGEEMGIGERLRDAGIEAIAYSPLWPRRRRRRWPSVVRRNHRKLVVIDARVGWLGSGNVGDEYAHVAGVRPFHDAYLRFEGPAVTELGRAFLGTWNRYSRQTLPRRRYLPREGEARRPPGRVAMAVVANRARRRRGRIRRSYLEAIHAARREILIANPYFVPDRGLRRALHGARRRGVGVVLLLPGELDVPLVRSASQSLYGAWLRRGVRIFEWRTGVLHMKLACIDGVWVSVGSYNLDWLSWRYNLEVNGVVLDAAFGVEVAAAFRHGLLAGAVEVDPAAWARRSWLQRLREWLAWRFRRWL